MNSQFFVRYIRPIIPTILIGIGFIFIGSRILLTGQLEDRGFKLFLGEYRYYVGVPLILFGLYAFLFSALIIKKIRNSPRGLGGSYRTPNTKVDKE